MNLLPLEWLYAHNAVRISCTHCGQVSFVILDRTRDERADHGKVQRFPIAVIGPAAPAGTAAKIKQMLKAAGVSYPVPIRRSAIPYGSFKTP